MILFGIDPGTATSGYGVIDVNYEKLTVKALDYGQIKTSKDNFMQERLVKIHQSARHLVEKYSPQALVIEKLFFNTNVKTAITVGQARGVFMLVAGEFKIPVYEYTALQAKMALTGYGRADKNDVRIAVKKVMNILTDIKPIDASDALAIALCHYLKLTTDDKKK
jgi:crossover junction endodeoxyribonuclease RuvC